MQISHEVKWPCIHLEDIKIAKIPLNKKDKCDLLTQVCHVTWTKEKLATLYNLLEYIIWNILA